VNKNEIQIDFDLDSTAKGVSQDWVSEIRFMVLKKDDKANMPNEE